MNRKCIVIVLLLVFGQLVQAQQTELWNGKKCAVVLTYDDALNIDLDIVIPALDSLNLKGTFYLIGESAAISKRIPEWRLAAQKGHELGNHSLTHPCDATFEGRSWVAPEKALNNFTVARAVNEIRIANTLLEAIDGKKERTFAFPCGDTKIGNVNFYDGLKNDFVGARGVQSGFKHIKEVDLNDINCFYIDGHSGQYMIDLVKKAIETHTLLVFLFHGVGGEHNINVSAKAHKELLQFMKLHEKEIWNAPMVDVSKFIREKQKS
ncbi:polysaccharide deacetylase family protein [Flavobacterium sp.]|uniref:polysaccharide deacetylase family protein n=1 Tax=Flavobacterium sp. TaxID=239 RepID=UPI002BEA89FE|nr:polysaccharide deacetylase family protein [Flavobacterium sp.]HSD08770.1 polysaccharide deacetylase family protein [Flavobacterium sp.]